MEIQWGLLFRNILLVIGEEASEEVWTLEDFQIIYKYGFNLPEKLELSEYPHLWAVYLEKALICAEERR